MKRRRLLHPPAERAPAFAWASWAHTFLQALVFPLRTSGIPALRGWPDLDEKPGALWPPGFLRHGRGAYGVLTTSLIVLDTDTKKGVKIDALERVLGVERTPTLRVLTKSRGRHTYLRPPTGVAVIGRVNAFGKGLDLRGSRNYAVGPGSVLNQKLYVIEQFAPVAMAPDRALRRLESEGLLLQAGQLPTPSSGRPVDPERAKASPALRRVLGRLRELKREGWLSTDRAGGSFQCPVHDDHRPSLSVTYKPDGRVLLRCFAGCTFAELLFALELAPYELHDASYEPGVWRP